MLRHASKYFFINEQDYINNGCSVSLDIMESIPYNDTCESPELGILHLSTNLQEYMFSTNCCYPGDKAMSVTDFLANAKQKPILFSIFRLTFCLITQISTSRELNRVSPNNIAERSTRYCSSKDGLEICKPWWWKDDYNERSYNERYWHESYENQCRSAESYYRNMLEFGMKPQDARGILPLDTATKVVYTYSVGQWKHILDLRYYEKTGKAHPNARLIMGMVRDKINKFAQSHGIDYQV